MTCIDLEESASHPLPLLEGVPQVVLEAHDIPRPGSGDLLQDRFCNIANMPVDGV